MSVRSRSLLCLVAALAGCGGGASEVEATRATRDRLVVSVATNGTVEPVDGLDLRARFDGRVLMIAEPGDRVAAGEPLVRIDVSGVAAALREAQAERLAALGALRDARDQLTTADKRAATDRQLFEAQALTKERLEEGRAERDRARARVQTLEREVPERVAALDLRIRELLDQGEGAERLAPFAGTVYQREVRAGEFVHAGDLLLRFADLEHLRVRANVDQVDLGRVGPGQTVHLSSNAFPHRAWTGRLTEVVPNVVVRDARSVSDGLAAIDPPAEGLVPGMTVDVEIVVDEARDALQVPADAVFVVGGSHYVQVLEGNRSVRRAVRVGRSTVHETEILAGLEEGDRVIVGWQGELPDGARVVARERDVAAGPAPD